VRTGQSKAIESRHTQRYRCAMKHLLLITSALMLVSCATLPFGLSSAKMQPSATIETRPAANPRAVTAPPPGAKTAAAFDTTTATQKAAALASAPASRALGKTIVTLGLVTEPGFWLRSGLVKTAGRGHIKTAAGDSVAVDLIPGTGATQLSLAAFRALNLPLTGFTEVQVLAE